MATLTREEQRRQLRELLLKHLVLRPCHVTGDHDPTHTTRHVCALQLRDALRQLLAELDIGWGDLPRALHVDCYWCDGDENTSSDGLAARAELAEWVEKGVTNGST